MIFAVFTLSIPLGGCKNYMDKAPEASILPEDAFKDFKSFQGFTEELYCCIVNPAIVQFTNEFNMADETLHSVTGRLSPKVDDGDYTQWQSASRSFMTSAFGVDTNPNSKNKGLWPLAWYGIRKANLGLANMDLLQNATQEEKDIIKGQLLFFRGYFYFELMKYWGGFPYLDKVLLPTDEMKLPRLNYRETALKAAADFEAAATLLPLKWDDTEVGKRTLGNNRQRVHRCLALSFLGKDLLYAASPCMNRESTGSASFDVELCKKAADAFSKVRALCEGTNPPYTLQPWATYKNMFFLVTGSSTLPGGVEVMWNPPVYEATAATWGNAYTVGQLYYMDEQHSPTANYVRNFGMKNGLPITDASSGYNPNDPWVNRDPRFYKLIVVDGDQVCTSTSAGPDRFIQIYTGGRHRGGTTGCVTGYLTNKNWDMTVNKFDIGQSSKYQALPPIMRLSDVYLMYAEAVLQGYGTPKSSFAGSITAEDAINRVRNRATLPNLDPKFTAAKAEFWEELIRERAVELCFEGLRWNDLQRWMLSGLTKYKEKTVLNFDRDPVTQKPINIKEVVQVTRVFDEKHYWFPLPVNQVTLYKEFKQNPGW